MSNNNRGYTRCHGLLMAGLVSTLLLATGEARAGEHDMVLLGGAGMAGVGATEMCSAMGTGSCGGSVEGVGLLLGGGYAYTWKLLRLGARLEGTMIVGDEHALGATAWTVAHVGLWTRWLLLDAGAGVGMFWVGSQRQAEVGWIVPVQARVGFRFLRNLAVVGSVTLAIGERALGGFVGGSLEWRL